MQSNNRKWGGGKVSNYIYITVCI